MSQETEPSLSEYARSYGLSINHLECNPLGCLPKESDVHSHLDDPDGVFKIDDSLDVDLREVPLAGKDEAVLLTSIIKSPCKTLAFDQVLGIDAHRFRNMKAELPMLTTDHENDMLRFASPIVPDLAHEHLPREIIDEEADEGLAWASRSRMLPDEYMVKAKEEQLEISKEDVRYMHETLYWNATGEEHPVFVAEHCTYKKVCIVHCENPSKVSPKLSISMFPLSL